MGGLFAVVWLVSLIAFIVFWRKKVKAKNDAGDSYESDENYLSVSKTKRIIGAVCIVSFVLAMALGGESAEEKAAREKKERTEFVTKLDGEYKTLYDVKFNEYSSSGKSEEEAQNLAVADVKSKQDENKKIAEEKAAQEKAAKEAQEKAELEAKAAAEKAEKEAKAAAEKAEKEAKAAAEKLAKEEKARNENNISIVRNGNFYSHPNIPVGAAFKKFFANGKWSAFTSTEGEQVVEFVGDCIWYDERAKLTMQFVVNGNEFEMRHVNINGVTFSYEESVAQLDKILDEY